MPSPWSRFGISSPGTVEVREGILVVLDCRLLAWLRSHKRRLLKRVADRPIAPQPLLEHAGEQRDLTVDVVVDAHHALPRPQPVKAPGVLDERALPRHGHSEK